MNGLVSISLAKGANDCETERGVIRQGESLTVPVSMAADLIAREPHGWVLASSADLAEVNAELKRRSAPSITTAVDADEEN